MTCVDEFDEDDTPFGRLPAFDDDADFVYVDPDRFILFDDPRRPVPEFKRIISRLDDDGRPDVVP